MKQILILLFISLAILPFGVPIWVSLGILAGLVYFMSINQDPYLFRVIIFFGIMIDLLSLQMLGMTSILLLVFIAMGYGLLFQFESTSAAILVVLTLILYMARQILVGQPVNFIGIIGVSLISWLVYFLLSKLFGHHSIKVRHL